MEIADIGLQKNYTEFYVRIVLFFPFQAQPLSDQFSDFRELKDLRFLGDFVYNLDYFGLIQLYTKFQPSTMAGTGQKVQYGGGGWC